MNRTKLVSLAVGLVAVVALVTASGAFSGLAADRSIDISVVDDDEAYLKIDGVGEKFNATEGDPVDTLEITNQFSEEADLTIELEDSPEGFDKDDFESDLESELKPGEDNTYTLEANCTASGEVTVTITAETDSAEVTANDRSFHLECE
ncbi:hypothetical protein OB919_11915 [Halobacteria archaeon AArc-curdl1]|uniref:Uncharacterized protein n=1 Tax=Natronosalvus hydrolyticus TaxID=2979988 RepID=A0AAP2Z8I7_9EURY|nr:hypothetical protein [Halobacteria archaeon AArc-curdl1]